MKVTRPWHTRTVEQTLPDLSVSQDGLKPKDAGERLLRFGQNELPQAERITPRTMLLEQFKNILIIILLIAVDLSAVLGEVLELIVIAVIVLFAILLGFVQEFRAERAMEALRAMAVPMATVLHSGRELEIPSREVVPGDLLLLGASDRTSADARLIEVANLKVKKRH